MRFSISMRGCSKSSASGIVHADRAGAEGRLALGDELLASVDREAAGPDDDFLGVEEEVQEHGHAPGMLAADPSHGREGDARVLARRDADPAGAGLGAPAIAGRRVPGDEEPAPLLLEREALAPPPLGYDTGGGARGGRPPGQEREERPRARAPTALGAPAALERGVGGRQQMRAR